MAVGAAGMFLLSSVFKDMPFRVDVTNTSVGN